MKTKTFDCVAMKHDIQQKLREQYGKTPWVERNAIVREAIRSDPHLSRLLKIAGLSSTEPEGHESAVIERPPSRSARTRSAATPGRRF